MNVPFKKDIYNWTYENEINSVDYIIEKFDMQFSCQSSSQSIANISIKKSINSVGAFGTLSSFV